MTRILRARKRSHCWRCERPIQVGQRIVRLGRLWIHVECAPAVAVVRRATPDTDDRSPVR